MAGVRAPWRGLSWFCRSRLSPSRSPKLFRPVEDDVRVVPANWRSSTDALPNELMVDDRPRRVRAARVGDDCPELRDPGRNRAVAGDADGLPKNVELCEGEATGVAVLLRPPVDGRGGSALVESRGAKEELEAVGCKPGALFFCGKWPMGNKGSGCFCLRRGRRKKVVVEVV